MEYRGNYSKEYNKHVTAQAWEENRRAEVEEDIKEQPGLAVVVSKDDAKTGKTFRTPAITTTPDALEKFSKEFGLRRGAASEGVCVRYLDRFDYDVVPVAQLALFEGYNVVKLNENGFIRVVIAMGRALTYNHRGLLPERWTLEQVYGRSAHEKDEKILITRKGSGSNSDNSSSASTGM